MGHKADVPVSCADCRVCKLLHIFFTRKEVSPRSFTSYVFPKPRELSLAGLQIDEFCVIGFSVITYKNGLTYVDGLFSLSTVPLR